MGGPASIRHRLSRGTPRRVSAERPFRRTVLIVGDGRTEPNYFDGLKREDVVSNRFTVTVKPGPGFSPERVVERAVKYRETAKRRGEDYDEVWCVLDVEAPDRRESLDKARGLAREAGLELCLSNPCFEVWFLAHFEKKARAYNGCDEVVSYLNKHWQKHFRQDYEKNDMGIYERLADRTEMALKNARWVRETHHRGTPGTVNCNSSTEVYQLVAHLTGSRGARQ